MVENCSLLSFAAGFATACILSKFFLSNNMLHKNKRQNDVDESDSDEDWDMDYKLVLVVRSDLKMGKGKVAAQCSHATLGAYKSCSKAVLDKWENCGQKKIVVQVPGEHEMMELYQQAKSSKICAHIVMDAGRTQIAAGSRTVLAVGPAHEDLVDRVTSNLKLY